MDKVEVAVHLLVLREGSRKNELRNQDDGDDQHAGLAVVHQRGDKQTDGHTAHRGQEERGKDDPEHSAHLEQGIPHEREEHALDHGEDAERQRLGYHVIAETDIQVALSQQDGAVADDVIDAVGQTQEHRHHQREEEIDRNVESRGEIVMLALRVAVDEADQEGQSRCRQKRDDEVGFVAQLADKGTLEQDEELGDFVAPAQTLPSRETRRQSAAGLRAGGDGRARGDGLLHLPHQAVGLEFVAPVFG